MGSFSVRPELPDRQQRLCAPLQRELLPAWFGRPAGGVRARDGQARRTGGPSDREVARQAEVRLLVGLSARLRAVACHSPRGRLRLVWYRVLARWVFPRCLRLRPGACPRSVLGRVVQLAAQLPRLARGRLVRSGSARSAEWPESGS